MNALEWFVGWRLKATLAIGLVVALGCIYALGSHNGLAAERERMKPVIAAYEVRIARLLDQLRIADDKIAQANDAIDQLKIEADEREKASKAAVKAARTLADRYRLRASQIAAARPTGDQCVAARTLIVETLAEERK